MAHHHGVPDAPRDRMGSDRARTNDDVGDEPGDVNPGTGDAVLPRFSTAVISVLVFSSWVLTTPMREWRNGRRAGFRCQCPSGRGGSTPLSRTAITGR